ncbi:MAG: ADOP family duplicated permease [Terriglobia bacterium]
MSRWARFFTHRKRMMDDLDQDIRDYIERETQDNIERGMPPEEARYAALRKFGNVTRIKEETRDIWSLVWLEQLWQDIRFGLRQLRRSPGFAVVAALTLALGIGSSTAIFSVVYPVFVEPYPYRGADRMVDFTIVGKAKGDERDWYSADEFRAVRDQNRVFDGLVAYSAFHKVLGGENVPEVVFVVQMNGGAFEYFGVSPLLGRVFTTADAPWGKPPAPVAVISFRFWTRHYASARNVLGQTIRLDGKVYTVIGVLPRRFAWHNAEVYLPYDQSWKYVWIGARLRSGVTLGQAIADDNLIFQQMAKLHPREYPLDGFSIKVQRLADWALGSFQESLLLLVAAVGLLLLIACANVVNLLLAKGNARETEIAVRASLGASRGRIVRQLLTESVTFSLAGGGLGVLLAYFGVRLIVSVMPLSGIPPEVVLGVNGRALLFAAVLSVAVGSLSGLAPALRMSKSALSESLSQAEKGGTAGSGRHRTRNAFIVAECALALVLLIVAGLTFRSFLALRAVRLGFDPSRILTMDMPVNWGSTGWQERVARLSATLNRVKALPGVQTAAVSMSTEPPPLPGLLHTPALAEGGTEAHSVQMNLVSSEFFQAFQVPLIRGRVFTNTEVQEGRQLAVVNRAMARLLWPPSANPVGRQLHLALGAWEVDRIGSPPGLNGWCQVVGIAGDVLNDGLQQPTQPGVYIPYSLLVDSEVTLTLRTASNPLLLANAVRSEIASEGSGQPVTNLSRYSDYIAEVMFSHDRFSAVLFLVFGSLGLALCASGIYSVVSFALSRRTHEIGIRMALGAQKGQVLRMVVRDTMTPVLIGFGLGLLGAAGVGRFIAHQLFGVCPTDPLTLALVSLILGAVALLACYIPARRATKADPMVALRYE